jgi:hypothetical protein
MRQRHKDHYVYNCVYRLRRSVLCAVAGRRSTVLAEFAMDQWRDGGKSLPVRGVLPHFMHISRITTGLCAFRLPSNAVSIFGELQPISSQELLLAKEQ